MKRTRRDFLKTAGAAALGTGVVLSASKRGYAQTKPALKWKAQCLWSLAETSYKAFEDFCKRVFAMTEKQCHAGHAPGLGVFQRQEPGPGDPR
jgi:anaerobic selenocysteine-containing dehydrogenase